MFFFLLFYFIFFFCWDERLYKDLYFDYIFIGNKRQSDGINGEPRVNWFPWSCSDIFCIHNISFTKSITNQSLSITAILSCHATRKSGTLKDETAVSGGRPIPYELDQPIIVCCTGLTCQHNVNIIIQNHDTVIRVYYWPCHATEVATKG